MPTYCYRLPNAPGIYEIRNVRNGKRYIGSGVSIRRRWGYHKYLFERNRHHNKYMQASWNKYGVGQRGRPCNRPLGIINHRLRAFTPDQVRDIRAKREAGVPYSQLCKEYSTETGNIYRIAYRKTYRDVI